VTHYPQKLALTSPTRGARSVGIVHLRTEAMEFSFLVLIQLWLCGYWASSLTRGRACHLPLPYPAVHDIYCIYNFTCRSLLSYGYTLLTVLYVKLNCPCNRPWKPIRLRDVRIQHFLNNRLAVDGEVVSLIRRPRFTPQESSWF
jgi:hypothetical protein